MSVLTYVAPQTDPKNSHDYYKKNIKAARCQYRGSETLSRRDGFGRSGPRILLTCDSIR